MIVTKLVRRKLEKWMVMDLFVQVLVSHGEFLCILNSTINVTVMFRF